MELKQPILLKLMAKSEIKCPTCKGSGFYRVDYALTREETHARCDDCEGKGKLENELIRQQKLSHSQDI